MNILIVHPDKGFYGGAEEVVSQLTNYLRFKGHRVQLVLEEKPYSLWKETQFWVEWADVINTHNFPANLAVIPTRKPIVWMCNEPPELFTNWKRKPIEAFNRWWVRKSKMKVVVSDQINAYRFQRIYGIEPRIIPYGVDYGYWSENPGVERAKEPIILQVGHMEFFPIGESIFQKVHKKFPEAKLIQLVGSTHEVVREKYHEASVLIHPVRSQGGWLVPFEAMSAGLPVVTTLSFTASSLVARLGGLSTIYGIDEMASAVCSILGNYNSFKDNSRAKNYIQTELTWEKYGEGMLRILKEVV